MFGNQFQKTVFYNGAISSNAIRTISNNSGSGGYYNGGGGSGGGGGGGSGGNTDTPVVLNYYSELALFNQTLTNLFYNYSLGNMDYIVSNLTKAVYYNLSIKLLQLKKDARIFPEYENIRISIGRALEGLYKSVLEYLDCQNMSKEIVILTEKESILHDMTKLKAYLESLAGSVSLFPDIEISTIAATLKPEIAEYIRLYGLPVGGVFEADKLAIALRNVKYVTT